MTQSTAEEVKEMNWFWLNIPLAAVFFGGSAGIPLWLVVRHPDRSPAPSAPAPAPAPARQPAAVQPTALIPQRSGHLVGV